MAGITRQHGSAQGRSSHAARAGFTLIETALAIVVLATGVLAILAAQQAFHMKNAWSTHTSTATWLANEIREMTLNLPRHDPVTGAFFWGPEGNEVSFEDYDDLDDFAGPLGTGLAFAAEDGSGPVSAHREVIANMAGWSQVVTVFNVDPFDINLVEANGTTEVMKVEVVVFYQPPNMDEPMEMTRVSWIAPQ